MTELSIAIVVGVGPEHGLGASLCRRFAKEGMLVYIAGRTAERITSIASDIKSEGGQAISFVMDATKEEDVIALFDAATAHGESVDLVVYNAGNNAPHDFRTMSAEFFENVWRVATFGGFLIGREAARRMVPQNHGTVLFTGATASLRSRAPFTAFASAKAALRAVAASMAREFGPRGLHVAHIVLDGGIDGEKIRNSAPHRVDENNLDLLLDPDAIASVYWDIHRQHPRARSFEIDLRTFKEPF